MSVIISQDTNHSKEMCKFEAQWTPYGPPGRPYVKREYPMMLHLAGEPKGKLGAITIVDTVIVESAREAEFHESRGFRDTPLEALEAYEAQQLEFAKLAAEQNYEVKNKLSPRAGAEVLAAQDAVAGHLPSVPVTPIRRGPGRPPNPKPNLPEAS